MKGLLLVAPCSDNFNEIILFLDRCKRVIYEYPIQIVLLCKKDSDVLITQLQKRLAAYSFATIVCYDKGSDSDCYISTIFAKSTVDFLGLIENNLQTDPFDIVKAYRVLQAQNYSKKLFVKGKRISQSFIDHICIMGISSFESLYLSTPLWDINAQPTIFHRSFFDAWNSSPVDKFLNLYAYYRAKEQGMTIVRFDVIAASSFFKRSLYGMPMGRWHVLKETISLSKIFKKHLL